MADYRQQQELEEERQALALEVLQRVIEHVTTPEDVVFLASELGVTYKQQEVA